MGLKNGQNTVFNKETAKIFGVETGYTLGFKDYQTFLKNIYDEYKKTLPPIETDIEV